MDELGSALVIEDDDDVRQLLRDILEQAGFDVVTASSGREGVALARERSPAVVTLDIGLPDIDGLEVLRRIRQLTDAYIVMLTGRDDETDTLLALQSGADDYMTKPFRPRELRARLTAMMRRPRSSVSLAATGSPAAAPPEAALPDAAPPDAGPPEAGPRGAGPGLPPRPAQPPHVIRHNGLTVDTAMRTATLEGETLDLTRSEFDLLRALLTAGGRVLTRAELVRVARGDRFRVDAYISDADERAVEVHIGNLRRKLDDDPRSPRWLITVRGVGYRLAPVRS
ncbi:response regulator transcription factor [Sinomonas mesophila]|uniref:response regulator transcription factor n=1 Tax=Sinomonas mesophila TaxID=1531955 RepID=UPI0009865D5E|nr:response regulator transcription factor [Sinomonas mesophila]